MGSLRNLSKKLLDYGKNILDIVLIIVVLSLMFSGYGIWALLGVLLYGVYLVWKGWPQVQMLLDMTGMTVDRYKTIKRLQKNDRLKNKRRD